MQRSSGSGQLSDRGAGIIRWVRSSRWDDLRSRHRPMGCESAGSEPPELITLMKMGRQQWKNGEPNEMGRPTWRSVIDPMGLSDLFLIRLMR